MTPHEAEVPFDEFNAAFAIMSVTDWVTIFKTISLDEASRDRSLHSERLVEADSEANPMPTGQVMDKSSPEEYLDSVHKNYLNCGNLDLVIVDTDGFAKCVDDDTASCGTGPYEVPSSEDIIQLRK